MDKTVNSHVNVQLNVLYFSGMFWRSDPTGREQLLGGYHWPKDGARLRGVIVEHEDEKWLKVWKVKQVGGEEWLEAPPGAYMPFEYDDHYYLDRIA